MAAADEARRAEAHGVWQRRIDAGDRSTPATLTIDVARDLIVGVIPHTQCVPRTEGCGFCTFPHDVASPRGRRDMLDAVLDEIQHHGRTPGLAGRRVSAIYIGGGTANLGEPDEIGRIVATLKSGFAIDGAELSLEGTPHLFERLLSSHLRTLAQQPTATKRISMGVQTFDDGFLRLMGREKFGDAGTVRKLVRKARGLGIATSADLLFNLPGQTPAQMDLDVDTAIACGLDQICLYTLVLYEGLGTPWSKDPALVAAMRAPDDACAQWLRLRERLLRAGYVQTTLTNFEREDVANGPHRFRYEAASFAVDATDGLGVGPLSLSTFVDLPAQRGLKLLRRKQIAGTPWSRDDLAFHYDDTTLPLLFVTRGLALTRLDGTRYRAAFGRSLVDDFALPLQACRAAGLVDVTGDDVVLTPTGMFFADSVVATLADGVVVRGAGVHTADLLRERPQAGDYLGMG
jgi:oxygen-independent coproporphyrinogen-3 oxidase